MKHSTAFRGRLRAAGSWTLPALATVVILFSCSTAPKTPDAVFDTKNKAAEYAKLAESFMATGQYDAAEKYYRDALQADSSVDNLEGVSVSHASLGRVYLAVGRPEDARPEFESALEYARMAGSSSAASNATSGFGEVSYALGAKEEALGLFQRAVTLAGNDNKPLAVALHDTAVAEAALGRGEDAMANLTRAAAINLGLKRWTELASNRYVLASVLAGANRIEEGRAMALKALEADKNAENGRGIAGDLAAIASLSARLGEKDAAWDYWRRAFDAALAVEDAKVVRTALLAMVPLADELGKTAEKAHYAGLLDKLNAGAASTPPSP